MNLLLSSNNAIIQVTCGETEITVEQMDITYCNVDMIAVPVDRHFSFSHGLSRSIAIAAGPSFKREVAEVSRRRLSYNPGEIRIFSGHNLKAKHVMGVVSSSDFQDIRSLYENILKVAEQKKVVSLCVSGIGTGHLGVPSDVAAISARLALSSYLSSDNSKFISLKKIYFVDLRSSMTNSFAEQFKMLSNKYIENSPCNSLSNEGAVNIDDNSEFDHLFSTYIHVVDETSSEEFCPVCLDDLSQITQDNPVVELSKCNHKFHKKCVKQAFTCLQAQCPVCKKWYGVPRGNQPLGGKMNVTLQPGKLPGYPDVNDYIKIHYLIPGGVQTRDHLRPGVPFSGTSRYAFLPNTPEGFLVLQLLRLAFRYRLIFTVGDSVTTGAKNVVVWNNIHHKTTLHGGPFGFPDSTYLDRVMEELTNVGITKELLQQTSF